MSAESFDDRVKFNGYVHAHLGGQTAHAGTWDAFYKDATGLDCSGFNEWHDRHWPKSCLSSCIGDKWLILFKMKVIRWREEGLI